MQRIDISSDLSDKIRNINFICTLLIALLHANTIMLLSEQESFIHHMENMVANGVCRIAVPYFFLIAGYLFFHRFRKGFFWEVYIRQVAKRCWTLAVPYLLVVLLFWGVLYVLKLISWFNNITLDVSFPGIMKYVFVSPRYSYQMWFVRDLFILCVLSPTLYFLLARYKAGSVALLGILAIGFIIRPEFFLFQSVSLAYFALGAFMQLHGNLARSVAFSKVYRLALIGGWLILCWPFIPWGRFTFIRDIFGILAVWFCYDLVSLAIVIKITKFTQYSFFLYLFHEPFLTLVKTTLWHIIPRSDSTAVLLYAVAFAVVLPILLAMAYITRKFLPKLYQLVCGGR